VLADLAASAQVEVRSSVAGYTKTCYAVTAMVGGKPVKGYVLGSGLPAIADFERERAAVAAASIIEVAPAPSAAPAAAPAPKAPAVEKPHYPPFANFSAVDSKGRAVSVRGMKGKINLVCFWSVNKAEASRELLLVRQLYGQYRKQGLDAMAVNFSGDSPQLRDTLDDFNLGFRSVVNGFDIAGKYGIDYQALPRTYVLSENFEVISSGLHGKALEELVKKLVTAE
jgi:AhpC/TSA family protein